MHGILKLRQMIQDDPTHGLARALRRASAPRSCRSTARRGPASGAVGRRGGHRQCLTPPGLELLAQELRRGARAATRPRHDALPRQGRDPRRARRRSSRRSRSCAARASRSWPASTASTTTPRSRASASSTSCSTWTRVDRITVKLRVPLDAPEVPSVTPDWPTADHQEREVYDMFGVVFDGPPRPAPHPHARGLRGPPAAPRLPDRRRARPLHDQRGRGPRLHRSASTCRRPMSHRASPSTAGWRSRSTSPSGAPDARRARRPTRSC